MKKLLGIIVLGLLIVSTVFISGCAKSSRWSNDPFYKHFETPYTIMWGKTVKKVVENEKQIAFWYLKNYVTKDELIAVAEIHCKSLNKSIINVEYRYYNNNAAGAIFACN